jgi:HEAT repeat protein
MTLRDHLVAIFDADRAARDAEGKLLGGDEKDVAKLLVEATREALALNDRSEAFLRLRRLPDLLAQAPGGETLDAMLSILDSDDETLRAEAGEAFLDVAYERFKDAAKAIERLVERKHDGLSMQELPFILNRIHDPDPIPLIARFLAHKNGEVAGAAIEALVQLGDAAAIPHIKKLENDKREITVEELDDGPITLGDLVESAIDELSGGAEE